MSNPFVMDGNELPGMWETADFIGGETDMDKSSDPNAPYDPMCKLFASEMDYLDTFREPDQTRASYVIENEGTYNSANGHFLCDTCYVRAGMPTAPNGWVCP